MNWYNAAAVLAAVIVLGVAGITALSHMLCALHSVPHCAG